MRQTSVVVIGGGQAGLAMSYCLRARQIDHVVLERGRIAERWRSERWDSLRLLTPNWQSRLPGFRYAGADPDGYMSADEVVQYFERYAASFRPPIETGVEVERVVHTCDTFRVGTTSGEWCAPAVVVATGYCDRPAIPSCAARLADDVLQLSPSAYRNPDRLPGGGVLVVGASASGVQLADEIQASGRPVTLAVGRHLRMPRRYRGFDIMWWLDRMGALEERVDDVFDADASRQQPSLQLVGRADLPALGLRELQARGVRLAGRLRSVDRATAIFDDDLIATTVAADVKLAALLTRIDRYIDSTGLTRIAEPATPFEPSWTLAMHDAPTQINLRDRDIRTVIWATGFRRSYPWLRLPVLDADGEIRERHGITPVPGLVVLGLPFLRKRNSAFIDGVGGDAAVLAAHLASHLAHIGEVTCDHC
jgi:putative flavoprotein involved in K+ transport